MNVTAVKLSGTPIDNSTGSNFELKELGRLVNLEALALQRLPRLPWLEKQAYGIPAVIFSLTKLEILTLVRVGLSGPIPAAISSLKNLGELRLDGNHLNGSIPAEIAKITVMRKLWLNDNELKVPFPLRFH